MNSGEKIIETRETMEDSNENWVKKGRLHWDWCDDVRKSMVLKTDRVYEILLVK